MHNDAILLTNVRNDAIILTVCENVTWGTKKEEEGGKKPRRTQLWPFFDNRRILIYSFTP